MKVRLLAVMAVVVVGVMAGTSPAMAQKAKTGSSKNQWKNQHKDNKVFGEAIHNLRKSSDSTNAALGTIAGEAIKALTALQTGLVGLAASYSNFQYGVVQLSYNGVPAASGAGAAFAGEAGASLPFLATPRIDPTSQQSTVSGQFKAPGTFNGGTGVVTAKVAVRSLSDPKTMDNQTTAYCRVTVAQPLTIGNFGTSKINAAAANLPFIPVQRAPLKPTAKSEELTSLVSLTTDDNAVAVNALGSTNSWNGSILSPGVGGFAATANAVVDVSLSCMYIDNQLLKDNGVTPPFAS